MDAPQNPAGAFSPEENYGRDRRNELIATIAAAPAALRTAVAGLMDNQLDTRYRNWTVRQTVHHIADSHVHSYIRCKWTLTEERPTIKPYNEEHWVELPDARTGEISPCLALLEGLHARWTQLLRSLTNEQFTRCFFHPETQQVVSLSAALCYYAWHGRHHTAQIQWLRERYGW
jgi:uncharacterized damage-inducible protein DinB